MRGERVASFTGGSEGISRRTTSWSCTPSDSTCQLLRSHTSLGASGGENVEHLTSVLCRELETAATQKASDVELSRVKEMLKSSMLMNLESRAIVMEDLGRQILAADKHVSAAELCAQVDAMTADDMTRVAKQMLGTEISVVAHGDTKNMPRLEVLKHHFGSLSKELTK